VYIVPNQEKSFGRSLSNVKLEEDPTISRLHAVISVEPSEESEESVCLFLFVCLSHRCMYDEIAPSDNAVSLSDIVQMCH